jgi:DNA mismatch endonuclease (patch repair protein)
MDHLTPNERSRLMARVHASNTTPELAVRSMVHHMGFRFRLNVPQLPGRPDLVFPSLRKIVFIHGCFWHGHTCRAGQNRPASNKDYWTAKLERNMSRDRLNVRRLRQAGWSVMTIWECQLRDAERIRAKLLRFLASV